VLLEVGRNVTLLCAIEFLTLDPEMHVIIPVADPVPEVFIITFLELPVSECELEYT